MELILKYKDRIPIKRKFYVYHLIDSRNNQVFYVGKGNNIRMFVHETRVRNKYKCGNIKLYNTIFKIIKSNNEILYSINYSTNNEDNALKREKKDIKALGIKNLCNSTLGGNGCVFSEEFKKTLNKQNIGKKLSEKHKNKLKKNHWTKNPVICEKVRKKISDTRKKNLKSGKSYIWQKGLTVETSDKLKKIYEKRSINQKKKYKSGEFIIWNKYLTKENDKRVAKFSKNTKKKFKTGERKPWSKGLTKENNDSLKKMGEKQSKIRKEYWKNKKKELLNVK
jgi:hypothetical protein